MAVVFIQDGDPAFISEGAGDDRYIVSALTATDQVVTIADAEGDNTLQLETGISIVSSSTTENFMTLTLSNGAVINIANADNFTFITGPADTTTGTGGTTETFDEFVVDTLGLASVPTGDTPVAGGAVDIVAGGSNPGDGGGTPPPTPMPGDEFLLTPDADDFEGTDDDDVFTAPLESFFPAVPTLQPFDRIDGGDGTDTLNATLGGFNQFAAPDVLDTAVTDVENFFFRSVVGPNAVSFAKVDEAEQIWADRMQENFFANDIEGPVTLGIVEGEEKIFTATYKADALGSKDFTQSVALKDADATLAAVAGGADIITGLDIALSGDSTLLLGGNLAAKEMTDVETSGDGSIDLDMTGNDGDLDVTLGDGDDALRLNSDDLDGSDDIDLGDGEDTLFLAGVANGKDVDDVDLSGVEGVDALGLIDDLNVNKDATLELGDLDTVIFEGKVSGGNELAIETTSDTLMLMFSDDANPQALAALELSEDVRDLLIETNSDLTIGALLNEDTKTDDSLESVMLSDTSEDGDSAIDVTLGTAGQAVEGFMEIELMGGDETTFAINAKDANFDSDVTVKIDGSGAKDADGGTLNGGAADEVTYINDVTPVREIFEFTGDNIGDVLIANFSVGVSGGDDRLDFSGFDGVDSLADLRIAEVAGGTLITANGGEFDGTIALAGIVGSIAEIEDTAFIF